MKIMFNTNWTSFKYIELLLVSGGGGWQYSTTGLIDTKFLKDTLDREYNCNKGNWFSKLHRLLLPTAYNSVGIATVQSLSNTSSPAKVTLHTFPVVTESNIPTISSNDYMLDKDKLTEGTTMQIVRGDDQAAYYWKGYTSETVDEGTKLYGDDYLTFIQVSDLDLIYVAGYN